MQELSTIYVFSGKAVGTSVLNLRANDIMPEEDSEDPEDSQEVEEDSQEVEEATHYWKSLQTVIGPLVMVPDVVQAVLF